MAEKLTSKEKIELVQWGVERVKEIYLKALDVLNNSISQTKAYPMVGQIGAQNLADLLHGGAYRADVWDLPYYQPSVQQQLTFATNPIGEIILGVIGTSYPITLPNGKVIQLPGGAKPEQVEVIVNSSVPHVLPKLLSDQQYYLMKEWDSLFLDVDVVKSAASSINVLVEGAEYHYGTTSTGEAKESLASEARALIPLLRNLVPSK